MQGSTFWGDPRGLFRSLHGFDAPAVKTRYRGPKKYLVGVYDELNAFEGTRIIDEGGGPVAQRYRHEWAPGTGPQLAADATGAGFLTGGHYTVTGHGVEDNKMAYHGMPYYGMHRSNPDGMAAVRTYVGVMAGLVVGAVANAAIQAIPSMRMGENWKDGLTAALGLTIAYLPSAGMGKVVGASVGVAMVGLTINRRWDTLGRITSWVHDKMAAMWDRALPPSNTTTTAPPAVTPHAGLPRRSTGAPTATWSTQQQRQAA